MGTDRRRSVGRRAVFIVAFFGCAAIGLPGVGRAAEPTAAGAKATRPASVSAARPATRPAAAPPDARITRDGWFAPLKARPKPKLPEKIYKAFVIPIHGGITETMADVVERKAIRCRTAGAKLVVFDMNTPGGRVDSMDRITQVITRDLADIYTVAYVNPEAISAGAIISLACDEIVLGPGARIGDAMPVQFSPQGGYLPIPKEERGKIESYVKVQVRTLAERNGYNIDLCEAMITLSIEIWLIRNEKTRELRYLNLEKHPKYVAKAKDDGGARTRPPLEEPWQYVRLIDKPGDLVTMTASEAIGLGFAKHVFEDMDELAAHYTVIGRPTVLSDSWSEHLVGFLTSTTVTSILVLILILGIYAELNTPGVGLPGAVALAALAVLLGSRYLTGLAQWWELALFVVGVVLIGVELFVTPGFGVMGISGLLCCFVAMLAIIIPNAPDKLPIPTTELDWSIFRSGLLAMGLGLLGGVVGAVVLARFLPRLPVANRLIRSPNAAPLAVGQAEQSLIGSIRPGQTGTVASVCRPVGQVRFGEKLVDAVADGAFIPAGAKVKVVKNEGNRVLVTPVET